MKMLEPTELDAFLVVLGRAADSESELLAFRKVRDHIRELTTENEEHANDAIQDGEYVKKLGECVKKLLVQRNEFARFVVANEECKCMYAPHRPSAELVRKAKEALDHG